MKKIIALLLALLMLSTFIGCSGDDEKPADEPVETAEVIDTTKNTVATPNTPKPIEAKLTRGKIEGQKYSSAYTGLNFTAPDGWEYSTDEAMAELLNMSADMLSEEKIAETLTGTTTVFDMIATNASNGNNVTVSYENMNYICGKAVSSEEYIEFLKERVGKQMQIDYEFMDEATVTLSGEEYRRVVVLAKTESFEMYQAYYVRVIDDVAISISTSLLGNTTVADVEAMFS